MERVLPQLKIVVKSDNRDWRTHFEQMKNLRNAIDQVSLCYLFVFEPIS